MKSKILIIAMLLISSISFAQVNPNVVVKDKTKFTKPVVTPPIDSDAIKCENAVHSNFRDIIAFLQEENSNYSGYQVTITAPSHNRDGSAYTIHGIGYAEAGASCTLVVKEAIMYYSNRNHFDRNQTDKVKLVFDMRNNTLRVTTNNRVQTIRNLKKVGNAFYGFESRGLPIVVQLKKNPRLM